MADLIKQKFRATFGLDAGGEKVINVAKADKEILSDGVNVEYFYEQNTIQHYDETRGYDKHFAVIFDNRIYYSLEEIASPAGAFTESKWQSLRVDPKWIYTPVTPPTGLALKPGTYISADTRNNDLLFTLPSNPQDGDTLYIKEIGGNAGYKELKIKKTNQRIQAYGNQVDEILITRPYSQVLMIFSNRLWQLFITEREDNGRIISPAAGESRIQAGDKVYRRSSLGKITIALPKNAIQGDVIELFDLDGRTQVNHLIVKVTNQEHSIGELLIKEQEVRTSGNGSLVFDASDKLWRVWEGDLRTRLRIIREDVSLLPNDAIMVFGANNAESKTINITLPASVAIGDSIDISLNYMRKGQKVNIIAGNGDTIATNKNLLQFPKRSEYPPDVEWVQVKSVQFDGALDYVPFLRLSYIEDRQAKTQYWVITESNPTVERVDSKTNETRKRVGVIALASQEQANANHENAPEKELAITPETLANRTATETRRGLARLATSKEMTLDTVADHLDDVIVTPKKFNECTATEVRRGVAEVATQVETNEGKDDTTIVTPKKLDARRATEGLAGIAPLVASGGVAGKDRDTVGTGIYERTEHTKQVTPKVLFENKATPTAQGGVYLATEVETISAPKDIPAFPLAVTPEQLHKKTATEERIGFSEIATQDETNKGVDDFRFITPKKLNERTANEKLTGIARIVTQEEFDLGENDRVISTPKKIKTHFNDLARTEVVDASGLVEEGTLWDHYKLDIKEASEDQRGTAKTATQLQVDAGEDEKTIVTPATLQKKKATEEVEGIVQIATSVETIAGKVVNKAVSPKNLINAIQIEKTWEATSIRRGPVTLSEEALTWVGNDTDGSTKEDSAYEHEGYVVSPREMNKTLRHYLPRLGKAYDSGMLGGQTPDKYIRRDINQEVKGKLTLTNDTIVKAPITSSSPAVFSDVSALKSITVGTDDVTSSGVINIKGEGNSWTSTAAAKTETLVFGSETPVLTLKKGGDVKVEQSLSAGNKVNADKAFTLADVVVIQDKAGSITIGSVSQPTVIQTKDASDIKVTDQNGTSTVITTNNFETQVGTKFVKLAGDTMTGSLTLENASVLSKRVPVNSSATPTSGTLGFWSAEIKDKAVYDTYPGAWTRKVNGEKDAEYKGPGTLTQFGNTLDTVYQDWVVKAPEVKNPARYTRSWDNTSKSWSTWSRVYSDLDRPSASEVGAVPSTDATFKDLTIIDWLQIGHVKIYPDEATRTVKFEWID